MASIAEGSSEILHTSTLKVLYADDKLDGVPPAQDPGSGIFKYKVYTHSLMVDARFIERMLHLDQSEYYNYGQEGVLRSDNFTVMNADGLSNVCFLRLENQEENCFTLFLGSNDSVCYINSKNVQFGVYTDAGYTSFPADDDVGFQVTFSRQEIQEFHGACKHVVTFCCEIRIPQQEAKSRLSNIGRDLGALLEKETCPDLTIYCGSETFKVHKCILMARSSYFQAMFGSYAVEQRDSEVRITDVEPGVVRAMLKYLYTDTVDDLEVQAGFGQIPVVRAKMAL